MDNYGLTTRVTDRPPRPASRRLTSMFIAGTSAAHLQTAPMTGTNLAATSAIAVLVNAPHQIGATAFVTSQMSAQAQRILPARGATRRSPLRGIHL